jgi:hypothetical protein
MQILTAHNAPAHRPQGQFVMDNNCAIIVCALILAGVGASLAANASGALGTALWGRATNLATAGSVLLIGSMVTICLCTITLARETNSLS